MSLLIKDMKMPKCCNNCEFHWEEDVSFEIIHQCQVKTGYIDNADIHSFPYDCPLVELPEKHGRLIDADALIKALIRKEPFNDCARVVIAECMEEVRHAPTVIETEGK